MAVEFTEVEGVGDIVATKLSPELANGIQDALDSSIEGLKSQVNDSFFEVANMFLELQSGLQQITDRIEIYNRKSSHKL